MTAPAIMSDHPTDQTLASFADHRLDPKEREAVMSHISSCGECFSIVETAWQFKESEEPVVRRFPFRLPVALTAIAASIAVVALALSPVRDWIMMQRTGGLPKVIEVYDRPPMRKIQSRLSGGYPYKEFSAPKRGEADGEALAIMQIEVLVGELQSASSWRELRALAGAQLLDAYRDPKQRDQAAKTLERALQEAGEEKPELINDLAAVHIERARFGAEGASEAALTYAERAWALEKTPESAFNRALAYQVANRHAQAIRAWQDYLALDSTSEWAKEAQQNLNRLTSPL